MLKILVVVALATAAASMPTSVAAVSGTTVRDGVVYTLTGPGQWPISTENGSHILVMTAGTDGVAVDYKALGEIPIIPPPREGPNLTQDVFFYSNGSSNLVISHGSGTFLLTSNALVNRPSFGVTASAHDDVSLAAGACVAYALLPDDVSSRPSVDADGEGVNFIVQGRSLISRQYTSTGAVHLLLEYEHYSMATLQACNPTDASVQVHAEFNYPARAGDTESVELYGPSAGASFHEEWAVLPAAVVGAVAAWILIRRRMGNR